MKGFYRLAVVCLCAAFIYSCSSNNVHDRKDWAHYLSDKGVTGCIMLHNSVLNTFEVYNLQGTQNRYAPAASFNIMIALAGLETGVIRDTNMVMRDSLNQPVAGISPDETMAMAFHRGDLPFLQQISRLVGKERMKFWMDSVKYGNMAVGIHIDSFWLDNTLRVSADEQLGLLQKLYYGKLPFQSRSQRLVKSLMLVDKTAKYQISYVLGSTSYAGKQVSWIVGWLEEKNRPHFFVLNVAAPASFKSIDEVTRDILYEVLKEQDLLGKD